MKETIIEAINEERLAHEKKESERIGYSYGRECGLKEGYNKGFTEGVIFMNEFYKTIIKKEVQDET